MIYEQVRHGYFVRRLNRFIAEVLIDSQLEKVHIKNTGRLKELLQPEVGVILEKSNNPNRKTDYSIIAVEKEGRFVNIDSLAPNVVICEALTAGKVKEIPSPQQLKREYTYGKSRFDLYIETDKGKGFIEVKGVTLEKNGIAMFPDAPTARGTKHILDLIRAKEAGYVVVILFLIQMKGCYQFQPHVDMDPQFTNMLFRAKDHGVEILAYDSIVTENELRLDQPIPISFT